MDGGNKADVRPQNLQPSELEGPSTVVFQGGNGALEREDDLTKGIQPVGSAAESCNHVS